MSRLPSAFALALAQLGDPGFVRVLAKSLLLTLAIFAVLGGALLYALYNYLISLGISFSAELSAFAAVLLTVLAAWLLFRLVALAVLQFFADDVVAAVEARHYPGAAVSARKLTFGEDLRNALGGAARALIVNLLALPFALLLLITGFGAPLLFWAVNAWLLGRELQDMAWLRHRHQAGAPSPIGGPTRFMLGGIVAALLLVPFVNLLAPMLGAAAATHLVHRRRPATNAA